MKLNYFFYFGFILLLSDGVSHKVLYYNYEFFELLILDLTVFHFPILLNEFDFLSYDLVFLYLTFHSA